MTTKTKRKLSTLPLDPLWDLAWRQSGLPKQSASVAADMAFSSIMFAEAVGHNVRAVSRWRETGRIPWQSADVAACKLGYLPGAIWHDEWYNVKGDLDKILAGKYDRGIEKALDVAWEKMYQNQVDALVAEVMT